MGSKKYPYKGIIDRLATRGFSNGTNAWTADDHTCYTVDTAGGQGFLQILPIYVDHILFPTITDEAFTTEVCTYCQNASRLLISIRSIMWIRRVTILESSTVRCKVEKIRLGT